MNLFVCLRPNHVLKAMLWSYHNGKNDDLFVVAIDEIPEMKVISERMSSNGFRVKNIKLLEINSKLINSKEKIKSLFKLPFCNRIIRKYLNIDISLILEEPVKHLYLFYDQNFVSNFFLQSFYKGGSEVHLIEDGSANYKVPTRPFKKNYRFLAGIFPLGYNPKIKSIYLFQPKSYKGLFKKKVRLLDEKYINFTLNEVFDKKIKNVFMPNFPDKKKFDDKILVILTQPLDKLKIISKGQQHEIYEKISKAYGGTCFIKKHPQDKNSYSSFSSYELPGEIPFEIIAKLFPKGSYFVTLYSSTILGEGYNLIKLIDPNSGSIEKQVLSLLNDDLSRIFD